MKELIIRISEHSQDVEILQNDLVKNEIKEKNVSLDTFLHKLKSLNSLTHRIHKPIYTHHSIIGHNVIDDEHLFIINHPECLRTITYDDGHDRKSFKISFPNSIYIVKTDMNRIQELRAYAYKEFKGLETSLYKYPFPNMLINNTVCLGNALNQVESDIEEALEMILTSPYSHSSFSDLKGFKDTLSYFEYLETHPFPYSLLIKSSETLNTIFTEGVR